MGRPKEYDPNDYIEEIENWLGSGRFLSEYCRLDGKPKRTLIHRWMEEDPSFKERVARAREKGEEVLFEQNLELVDEEPPRDNNGRIDPGFVAWQKNRIWARMEMLKKINPSKYGDKVEKTVQGPNGGPVQQAITINLIDSGDE